MSALDKQIARFRNIMGLGNDLRKAEKPEGDNGEPEININLPGGEGEGNKPDDQGDDQYDEKYMKKYMKRYLKDNPEDGLKFMKDNPEAIAKYMKEAPEMQKALNFAGAEIGAEDAVYMADGAEMFKAFSSLANSQDAAIRALSAGLQALTAEVKTLREAGAITGEVLFKAAGALDAITGSPNPLRAAQAGGAGGGVLMKAQQIGRERVQGLLLVKAEQGDQNALRVISEIDDARGNFSRLPQNSQDYLAGILATIN